MSNYIRYKINQLEKIEVPESPVERSHVLKTSQVILNTLEKKRAKAHYALKGAREDLKETEKRIKVIEETMQKLTSKSNKPEVTEHALLRYIERVLGIDLDDVYKQIVALPEQDKSVVNDTIVTVFPTPER